MSILVSTPERLGKDDLELLSNTYLNTQSFPRKGVVVV